MSKPPVITVTSDGMRFNGYWFDCYWEPKKRGPGRWVPLAVGRVWVGDKAK